jgi:hypothetical protein
MQKGYSLRIISSRRAVALGIVCGTKEVSLVPNSYFLSHVPSQLRAPASSNRQRYAPITNRHPPKPPTPLRRGPLPTHRTRRPPSDRDAAGSAGLHRVPGNSRTATGIRYARLCNRVPPAQVQTTTATKEPSSLRSTRIRFVRAVVLRKLCLSHRSTPGRATLGGGVRIRSHVALLHHF